MSRRARIKTSRAKIAEYWWDNWRKHTNFQPAMFGDICEPMCWACAGYWGEFDERLAVFNRRAWERTSLHRHHIMPYAAGGKDVPHNYFLLCPDCHRNAPHTTEPQIFFDWLPYAFGSRCAEVFAAAKYMRGVVGVEDDEKWNRLVTEYFEMGKINEGKSTRNFSGRLVATVAHDFVGWARLRDGRGNREM